ncbi:MAG: ABC transporter ATP-binding protein [Pirellula sp.]|nr:ABC transporter ATP-binding protein [Pirellula sp.]
MIELKGVTVKSGSFVLPNISFQILSGEYAVLMGTSGRGKTTLLESICGLRRVAEGQVLIHGRDVTRWSPADREIGYVPQDLALFPKLSVLEHLEFALRLRKLSREVVTERTRELSEVLGIGHLLSRSIAGLSGGEAQRVALGRALSFRPSVLLLDEPLSALDESTRYEMHELLRRVKQTTGVTTLHVTHSVSEAESLADRCFWLAADGIQERPLSQIC